MEHRDLSIVIDDDFYGRVFPDTDDTIYRYKDERFSHLRYHAGVTVRNGETTHHLFQIRALFLGAFALETAATAGIPEAYVDLPTKQIYEAYEQDQIARFEVEMGDIDDQT